MKVNYTTSSGKISVSKLKQIRKLRLFQQLANFQEIFAETKCGKCGSENIRFQVRNVDDNLYYELRCMDCGAKLAFRCHEKGWKTIPQTERQRRQMACLITDGLNGTQTLKRKSND